MLLLEFRVGTDRYALEASQVTEVLPLVNVRAVPQAPAGIAGIFDFRGVAVPVIDLSALLVNRPAQPCMSTRLVIVGYPDAAGEMRALGLIAERVTRTVVKQPEDFMDSGITHDRAWYLGPVSNDADGLLQWIDVSQLLPAAVRDVLFRTRGDARWPSLNSNAC